MVEEKVLGFSLERIEQIVRATTQRELDVIIRLGYVLGGIVGLTAYAVTLLLSSFVSEVSTLSAQADG